MHSQYARHAFDYDHWWMQRFCARNEDCARNAAKNRQQLPFSNSSDLSKSRQLWALNLQYFVVKTALSEWVTSKKCRAFVFEHQGHCVPATSSKKNEKKKNLHEASQNKPKGLVQHTSKNTQNKQTMVACSKKQTSKKKKFKREHFVWKKFHSWQNRTSHFFCTLYKRQALGKHEQMTEKDVPTLIHWRKPPNNRSWCWNDRPHLLAKPTR